MESTCQIRATLPRRREWRNDVFHSADTRRAGHRFSVGVVGKGISAAAPAMLASYRWWPRRPQLDVAAPAA